VLCLAAGAHRLAAGVAAGVVGDVVVAVGVLGDGCGAAVSEGRSEGEGWFVLLGSVPCLGLALCLGLLLLSIKGGEGREGVG